MTCTHTPVGKLVKVRQGGNVVRICVLKILHLISKISGQQLVFCMYSDGASFRQGGYKWSCHHKREDVPVSR